MLEKVNWDNYKLQGSICWEYLPRSLTYFSVHYNQLTGELQMSNLPPQLAYFFVDSNNLIGTPDFTRLPQTMNVLGLSENLFHGVLDFSKISDSLSAIWLQDNVELGGILGEHVMPKRTTYDMRGTNIEVWNGKRKRDTTRWADGRITYQYY